jgi:hypothetical protein
MNETETAIVTSQDATFSVSRHDPRALALRLADMKANRALTAQFFRDVLEEGVDYGVIPGTDKPTLYKAGAESLCELYGYAPTYTIDETKDLETGFLRCVVTTTLIQRGTGEVVAQGVGECNTREAKYFYRWMPEWEIKKFPDLVSVKETLKKEERSWTDKKTKERRKTMFYRIENDDLFTLWNTVLKMAKKRSHVDATLSATRSSGLFLKGKEGLEDFIEAEYAETPEEPAQDEPEATVQAPPRPAPPIPPTGPTPEPSAKDQTALAAECIALFTELQQTVDIDYFNDRKNAIREEVPNAVKNGKFAVKDLELEELKALHRILSDAVGKPTQEELL